MLSLAANQQLITWLPIDCADKNTWPALRIEMVLIETNWKKYIARLVDHEHLGVVFQCNENPLKFISMTTVRRWARIDV